MNTENESRQETPIIRYFKPINVDDNHIETSNDSDNTSEYGSVISSHSTSRNSSPPSRNSSPPLRVSPSPVQSPEFTWAFFNCPATINIAGLLLLVGGLFTLTIGAIVASASMATTGAVIAGAGALLGLYGQFNTLRCGQNGSLDQLGVGQATCKNTHPKNDL